MILVDFSQIAISALNAETKGNLHSFSSESVGLMKYIILNSLRFNRRKFKDTYGELVICCDSRSWRKNVFPYYKASRSSDRDESLIDWTLIFDSLDVLKDDLRIFFPYKVLQVYNAEADDIIGVLAETFIDRGGFGDAPERNLILSGDKDFIQLQQFGVDQYNPVLKKFIKPEISWNKTLREHIVKGDKGDGVPNMRSPDDTFVEKKRQAVITAKYLDRWSTLPEEILFRSGTEEEQSRYKRNKQLIDLSFTPVLLKEQILSDYNSTIASNRRHILDYFIQNKMKGLTAFLGDF